MSKIYSYSDLKFVSRNNLKSWVKNGVTTNGGKFMIIDVRESDYMGGHIKNSLHYPANTFYEFLPDLYKKVYDERIKTVVFHCMLSQARGPSSTLRFLRGIEDIKQPRVKEFLENVDVLVLKGGFSKWQQDYGLDKELTDDYNEELWNFGN